MQRFIERYPGTLEPTHPDTTTGFPAWARWQHFLNLFLLVFIIRSGVQILSDHPRLYWTRHSTPGRDWFRIQKPVPADPLWTAKQDSISLPGPGRPAGAAPLDRPGPLVASGRRRAVAAQRRRSSYVLLFATGHWQRLVPTSWDVFPNALSVLIQYLSLDWPTENGWVAYNACS